MQRTSGAERRDRILAAIEIPALGIWVGALAGFAFFFAPAAFRTVAPLDVGRFAALIAGEVNALCVLGYVLGGLAILAAILRALEDGDRRPAFVRVVLVAAALGGAAIEQRAIVPAMEATTDLRSPAYHALHQRSSRLYGGVVLLALGALILAASARAR